MLQEYSEISNIDSFAGSGHSLYIFLVYWVTYALNSVSFFGCPTAETVRENLWIGIIVVIGLFFLVPFITKKN